MAKQIPLNNVKLVAAECARVYRLARGGELDIGDAVKLASILATTKNCLEVSALEQKLDELEQHVRNGPNVLPFNRRAL
jgi:hypothetical protein